MKKALLCIISILIFSHVYGQGNMSNNMTPLGMPVPTPNRNQETNRAPILLSPTNGSTVGMQPVFKWTPVIPKPRDPATSRKRVWQLMEGQTGTQARANKPPKPPFDDVTYKIKIVEIKGDQSPEEALRTNKPFFEKDSIHGNPITIVTISLPQNPDATKINKPRVEKDTIPGYPITGITISLPSNPPDNYNKPHFEKDSVPSSAVIQPPILGNGVGNQAARRGNQPLLDKMLAPITFNLPVGAPDFTPGKKYIWTIQTLNSNGNIWNVQALDRDGKPIVTNNGTSRPAVFSISSKR